MATQYRHYDGNKNYNTQYVENQSTSCFSCTASCSCKHTQNRSEYDVVQYNNLVVKNKPMMLPNKTLPQSRGLSFDPNDPIYDPIGGIGGVGWN